MDFEFELQLSDGRLVSAVGKSIVLHQCDCLDTRDLHPHIQNNVYDSIIDVGTGKEIERTNKIMVEIEDETDSYIYQELDDRDCA